MVRWLWSSAGAVEFYVASAVIIGPWSMHMLCLDNIGWEFWDTVGQGSVARPDLNSS